MFVRYDHCRDLDGCRDPETGRIDYWAQKIIFECDSYVEVTPSGTGLRVFGYAQGTYVDTKWPVGRGQIEVYRRAKRYLTITGDQPGELRGCNALGNIDNLIDKLLAKQPQKSTTKKSARKSAPARKLATSLEEISKRLYEIDNRAQDEVCAIDELLLSIDEVFDFLDLIAERRDEISAQVSAAEDATFDADRDAPLRSTIERIARQLPAFEELAARVTAIKALVEQQQRAIEDLMDPQKPLRQPSIGKRTAVAEASELIDLLPLSIDEIFAQCCLNNSYRDKLNVTTNDRSRYLGRLIKSFTITALNNKKLTREHIYTLVWRCAANKYRDRGDEGHKILSDYVNEIWSETWARQQKYWGAQRD